MSDELVPRPLRLAAAYCWRLLVVAAAVVVSALVLVELRLVVLPVILALLLSTLLVPPARWLWRRGVPRLLATAAVLAAAALLLVGAGAAVAPALVNELGTIERDAREGAAEVLDWLAESPLGLSEADVDRYVERAFDQARANSGAITGGLVAGAVVFVEVIAGLLLTLVLLFFFVKDGESMWRSFLRLLPERRRHEVDELGTRAWRVLGAYLRGIGVVAVVDATLIGVALLLIGVPLVVPLVVLTFFGAFFPLVGAFLAGTLAALVALVTEGVLAAVLVVVAITVIQQLEGDLLYPLVVGRTVDLHPVAILLALTAGAVVGGVVGAFLAVPALAIAVKSAAYLRR